MRKTVASNIAQALQSRGFLIGFLAVACLLFLSSIEGILSAFRSETLLSNGYHAAFVMNALSSDAMTLALPIVAALPYTSSFVDDVKSGFVKVYLPRTTTNGYILGKLSACGISGGLALSLGILTAYGVSALLFTPMEAVLTEGAEVPAYFGELMGKVLLFFCSGVFWALVGLLFATLTGSRYMAYASPFVIYYVLIILYERYFDTLYVLYPKEWLLPSTRWCFGNLSVVIWVGELIIIVSLCFYLAAKRRLRQI